jgi:hypothetical protein
MEYFYQPAKIGIHEKNMYPSEFGKLGMWEFLKSCGDPKLSCKLLAILARKLMVKCGAQFLKRQLFDAI